MLILIILIRFREDKYLILNRLADLAGFEPATFGLEVRRPIYTIFIYIKTSRLGYRSSIFVSIRLIF